MEAKDYLSQVIKLENSLFNKKEQLIVLEQKMLYTSPAFNNDAGSGLSVTYTVDKIPMHIANKEQLENDIKYIEKELVLKKAEILETIDQLEDEVISEILFMRYLRKMPMNVIADRLSRPNKWVYRKHSDGVSAVQVMIFNNEIRG